MEFRLQGKGEVSVGYEFRSVHDDRPRKDEVCRKFWDFYLQSQETLARRGICEYEFVRPRVEETIRELRREIDKLTPIECGGVMRLISEFESQLCILATISDSVSGDKEALVTFVREMPGNLLAMMRSLTRSPSISPKDRSVSPRGCDENLEWLQGKYDVPVERTGNRASSCLWGDVVGK